MGAPRRGESNPRRRSFWRAVTLSGLVVLVSPLRSTLLGPISLVLVPAAIWLLAFGPRSRVRFFTALWLLAVAAIGVTRPTEMWFVERGWAVLVGGGFAVAAGLFPHWSLFARAGLAVVVAALAVGVAAVLRPELFTSLDWQIAGQWEESLAEVDLVGRSGASLAEAARSVVEAATVVMPARLALASMAALGCTAYTTGRLGGEEAPLGPMREFRFGDQLVWILVGGLVLLVLPLGAWADRTGLNLAALMGGLYVARGVAVLVWIGTSVVRSGWSTALWVVAALLLYPVTIGTAFVMGLSDTWLDLRTRLRVESEAE